MECRNTACHQDRGGIRHQGTEVHQEVQECGVRGLHRGIRVDSTVAALVQGRLDLVVLLRGIHGDQEALLHHRVVIQEAGRHRIDPGVVVVGAAMVVVATEVRKRSLQASRLTDGMGTSLVVSQSTTRTKCMKVTLPIGITMVLHKDHHHKDRRRLNNGNTTITARRRDGKAVHPVHHKCTKRPCMQVKAIGKAVEVVDL